MALILPKVERNALTTSISKYIPHHDLTEFDIKESSGASQVYLHPKSRWAVQKFVSRSKAKHIFLLYSSILNTYHITRKENWMVPDVRLYIAKLEVYVPQDVIIWRRHICLNELTYEGRARLIELNLIKLLTDVTRAIISFDNAGILHRDIRIDNIGMNESNFLVFDFDAAITYREYEKAGGRISPTMDLERFIQSVNFHTEGKLAEQIPRACNPQLYLAILENLLDTDYIVYCD